LKSIQFVREQWDSADAATQFIGAKAKFCVMLEEMHIAS
jgi:hypothetical protein